MFACTTTYMVDSRLRYTMAAFALLICSAVWGQVFTPQGSEITSAYPMFEYLSAAQKEAKKQYYARTYPKAIFLGEATTTYNCHNYAWNMTEGGEKYWMNDPAAYMTDGSYVSTHSTDPKATKVYYDNGLMYAHSAVIPYSGSRYLVSKWGEGPLMRHSPWDSPYDAGHLKYYKLSMEIKGEESVSLPDPHSKVTEAYTLTNVPDGATVEWSTDGNGITILSGQGTSTIQAEIGVSQTGRIKAKVHCPTGLVVNIPYDLSIKASAAPIITDIQLIEYGSEYILKAVTNEPDGIFTWSVSGNAELCENPYAGDASFSVEPNTFTGVRFYEMGIYTVTVTGRRTDSWYDYTFSKDFTITEVSDKRPGTP